MQNSRQSTIQSRNPFDKILKSNLLGILIPQLITLISPFWIHANPGYAAKLSRQLELLRCKLSNSVINVFKVLHLSELGYCNQCVWLDTLVSTYIFISWLIRPNPVNVWKYIKSEFILVLVNSVLTRYITMIWLI